MVIALGRNSLAIEDTTTFGKTVVLYMEMQRSDVMVNRGAQCYAISVPRLMMYYVITSLGTDMFFHHLARTDKYPVSNVLNKVLLLFLNTST